MDILPVVRPKNHERGRKLEPPCAVLAVPESSDLGSREGKLRRPSPPRLVDRHLHEHDGGVDGEDAAIKEMTLPGDVRRGFGVQNGVVFSPVVTRLMRGWYSLTMNLPAAKAATRACLGRGGSLGWFRINPMASENRAIAASGYGGGVGSCRCWCRSWRRHTGCAISAASTPVSSAAGRAGR